MRVQEEQFIRLPLEFPLIQHGLELAIQQSVDGGSFLLQRPLAFVMKQHKKIKRFLFNPSMLDVYLHYLHESPLYGGRGRLVIRDVWSHAPHIRRPDDLVELELEAN